MIKFRINAKKVIADLENRFGRKGREFKDRLEKAVKSKTWDNAIDYFEKVIGAIETQKYAHEYDPYSDKYKEWKEKAVGHLRFWELTGDLIGAMEFKEDENARSGYNVFSGLDGKGKAGQTGSVSDEKIIDYARKNEGGWVNSVGGVISPRPLFSKVSFEIRREALERIHDVYRSIMSEVWGR